MGRGAGVEDSLLPPPPMGKAEDNRSASYAGDELKSFRLCLRWMCMDQSGPWWAAVSWSLFLLLGVAVPAFSHLVLAYSPHRRPYNLLVELSLSGAATIAFLSLSTLLSSYGLRRLLFLDKLDGESRRVRKGYHVQLSHSFRLLATFVVPGYAAEAAFKVWWYSAGVGRMPFLGSPVVSDAVAFTMELASWIYRTGLFFLVCVLFHLICSLEILRLQDFAAVFREESEVSAVLREHLRIRRQLRVISHRFRSFIVAGIILVTASQFGALLLTTRPHADVSLFNVGELALGSIGLVTGLLICLRSAAKITHKAQALTSHAAKWHVCASIDFYEIDTETPSGVSINGVVAVDVTEDGSDEGEASDEDELEDTKLMHPHANTISFQRRQALVTYFENNRAGITIFGFMMDRAWLHTIFMIQLSLVLWLFNKTIGMSIIS